MPVQNFVPPELLPALAKLKPYVLVVLRKGVNYSSPNTPKIIQSEHLPHVFKNIELGHVAISLPVRDETDIAAIAIFNTDKETARLIMEEDPGVKQGVFTYELLNAIGLPGARLQ